MFFKKQSSQKAPKGKDTEKTKIEIYTQKVRRASLLFTAASVLCFVAAVLFFLTLLTTFTENTASAVTSALLTAASLALGLYINGYTKKESDALCKLKRRPLGYLMRAALKKEILTLLTVILVLTAASVTASFVIYAKAASLPLLLGAVSLIITLLLSVGGFAVNELSRKYVLGELEFFEALENDFAKKTHRI